jgi:hypothetical protein
MNRLLILSDRLVIRSDDEPPNSFRTCPAQTPPPAGARFAADRTPPARHIGRGLQALRTTELPLCRWAWAWPQVRYLSISQPGGRPRRDYVPNDVHVQVAQSIADFRKLRDMLNEICAINTELLRRREDLS